MKKEPEPKNRHERRKVAAEQRKKRIGRCKGRSIAMKAIAIIVEGSKAA